MIVSSFSNNNQGEEAQIQEDGTPLLNPDSNEPDLDELCAALESLLFVAPGEVNPAQLAAALGIQVVEIERGLSELAERYARPNSGRGLRLQHFRGRYQLTTAPQVSLAVERFLGLEISSRLSKAALDTLAIVLYRQPVTRPQIDAIRGVGSDTVLHSLLIRDLIQEVGRAESPGRPILYSVTPECLQFFGLTSLTDLPPLELEEIEQGASEQQSLD
jgi:segregation and condensation protein B